MEVLDLRREGAPNNFIAHKGRVERLFGTFQDRLVAELRLAQARTLEEAQRVFDRFLPRYNARFAHPPPHPDPAWQPPPADLERICCFKYQRTVGHDNTIQLDGRRLQLQPGPGGRSYANARVDIHAYLNGTLAVYYRGQRLAAKRLPHGHRPRTLKRRDPVLELRPPRPKGHIPPVDHPWRRGAKARARRKALKAHGVTSSWTR